MSPRAGREPTRRLFVAVDLDREAQRAAGSAIARIAAGLGPLAHGVRWVEAGQLHVTLRFLGHLPIDRAERVRDALAPAWRTGAFELVIGGAGLFPPSGAPRVVWLDLPAGREGLTALHQEASTRLAAAGIEPEGRRFHPHLTVGRVKRAVHGLREALRRELADVGRLARCRIAHLTLYESRQSPAGSRYHPLLEARLEDRPPG
jgi:RNA 2',3'-cyclic 3'-phosphodiesterase